MAEHNELGKKGEDAAAHYLRQKGHTILERNWVCEKYEIDIITRDDEYIVFVEVKTRSANQWGNPEEAVSKGKIKRIVNAADFYLIKNDIELPARFDIIAMIWDGQKFEIDHIDDAFLPPVN
jgi:putative endonuclease